MNDQNNPNNQNNQQHYRPHQQNDPFPPNQQYRKPNPPNNGVKIIAIILAILLSVLIVRTAFSVVLGIATSANLITTRQQNLFSWNTNNHHNNNGHGWFSQSLATKDFSQSLSGVEAIEVDGIASNLVFVSGNEYRVDATSVCNDLLCEVTDGVLRLSDPCSHLNVSKDSTITITLRSSKQLNEISVANCAGRLSLDSVDTRSLQLDSIVGKMTGTSIIADTCQIDGGVGEIDLRDVSFGQFDLDSGVGKVSINGTLLNQSTIDAGVGEINLRLRQPKDSCFFSFDDPDNLFKSCKIDGQAVNHSQYGDPSAPNTIDINNGLGKIDIRFVN